MNSWSNAKSAGLAFLSIYRLVFVVLSLDIIVRIWGMRMRFDSPFDVAMLLFMEGLRTLVTLGGIALAWRAARMAARGAVPASLAFGISFATIAYTKVMTYDSFPGAVQEELAKAFVRWNVPKALLLVVFAEPAWAAWLTLAGLAVFALQYPRQLRAEDVLASGGADRPGALRSVAMAGADIGSLSRRWTASLLANGWLTTARVWAIAAIFGTLHTAAAILLPESAQVANVVGASVVAGVLIAVCVTLFRASTSIANADERYMLDRMRRAGAAGFLLFVLSGIALLLPQAVMLGFFGLSLAPAVVLVGLASAFRRVSGARR